MLNCMFYQTHTALVSIRDFKTIKKYLKEDVCVGHKLEGRSHPRENFRVSPHCTKAQLVRQVCVVRQEGSEEVLGKRVHGNTLSVDDLPQTTEGTTWTYGEAENSTSELRCPSYQIAGLS